jgi:hypothetical protein
MAINFVTISVKTDDNKAEFRNKNQALKGT